MFKNANQTKRKISTHYKSVHPKSLYNRSGRRNMRINGCNHHCYIAIHQIGNHLKAKYNCWCSEHMFLYQKTYMKGIVLSRSTKSHLDSILAMTHHCCRPEFVVNKKKNVNGVCFRDDWEWKTYTITSSVTFVIASNTLSIVTSELIFRTTIVCWFHLGFSNDKNLKLKIINMKFRFIERA